VAAIGDVVLYGEVDDDDDAGAGCDVCSLTELVD
jgi:hypothetical protein